MCIYIYIFIQLVYLFEGCYDVAGHSFQHWSSMPERTRSVGAVGAVGGSTLITKYIYIIIFITAIIIKLLFIIIIITIFIIE